jgi:hypothetical protein
VDVNFADPFASRAWIRNLVRQEIQLRGQPHPKIYLLGKNFVETLDLDSMSRREPGAHLGRTFQDLRRRNNVQRCFVVLGGQGADPMGVMHHIAVVFEELDVADGRRWWLAIQEYQVDATSGLGQAVGEWEQPPHDTNNPADLPAFLVELAAPPPGARPAVVRDASDTWAPDIKFCFGELPPEANPPTDAKQMVELAAALGSVDGLLTGKLQGTVVVRIAGRSWEQFVLSGEMPASMLEMIRWIASNRLPAADGVALAQIAIRPQDKPPVPGMQVIGELGGRVVETWAPLEFPEGPRGKKVIPQIHWWPAKPVEARLQWLGVASKVELQHPGEIS